MSDEASTNIQMVINYVPGEECRVAIVEDGKLEELHVERFSQASRVGNIYVGRVENVEPAIQAAFIDFGLEENGFLHVSDLHPKYFPGEDDETTERVGFKTPRRERPPIQRALRRGDEVIVQVLKEGVGTKGPAVTTYLSIPGRFLVMMPGMDNVGVSRKVEDEDQRRKMREILDQLDLPEGFGFILRTAGLDRTKLELKRDLAYLQRLWKDMEKRLKVGGKPRLLYSESDLLVRSLRDLLTSEINEVVIDHEAALQRAARFMKIVSPRSSTRLVHYPGKTPIFHAFGIEPQITLMHAREVPLPSGGRLVIDQTEALVAIDVNSGKSRDSRNSEENAYQTNLEAVDEICRQLRLRDMGGIVVNDLIDMRRTEHRKDVENRFKERLKRDRAKTTVAMISEFGILEMTRQRMRPSHESVHFSDCQTCRGRGLVQKPDSVASDALRELALLLDAEKVHKVEMVVSPRVAGELLSSKRKLLSRIERTMAKAVDVRVSEQMAADRVTFYAYDAQGADIDLGQLPRPRKPRDLKVWEEPHDASADWADVGDAPAMVEEDAEPAEEVMPLPHPIEMDESGEAGADEGGEGGMSPLSTEGGRRRRRRRRGRGRGRGEGGDLRAEQGPRDADRTGDRTGDRAGDRVGDRAPTEREAPAQGEMSPEPGAPASDAPASGPGEGEPGEGGGRRRRRRRRRRGGRGRDGQPVLGPDGQPLPDQRPADAEDRAPLGDDETDEHGAAPSREAPAEQGGTRASSSPAPADAEFEDDAAEEGEAGHTAEGGEGGADAQGEGDGERRRRRRRRRRGGRGRGGAAGGQPGGQAAGQAGEGGGQGMSGATAGPGGSGEQPRGGQREGDRRRDGQRQGGREGGRPDGRQGGRDGRRDGQRDGRREPRRDGGDVPRVEPKPLSAPQPPKAANQAPGNPPGNQPRTLYGAARRKLNPSELNRRPKPE